MHLAGYKIVERASDFSEFHFISNGPNGMIRKVIVFEPLEDSYLPLGNNLYNIALLDVLPDGTLSDKNLSNNNDLSKILITTVQILAGYTTIFPDRAIFIQGSDEAGQRTSLYHRAIKNNFTVFEHDFDIEGIVSSSVKEKFNPAKKYIAFLVRRK